MKNRVFEIVVGIIVIMISLVFIVYVAKIVRTSSSSYYVVNVRFNNIGSLIEGSSVNINGVKIGKVNKISIDTKTYLVTVKMFIDNNIKIDKDSKVQIQASGFFESPNIIIVPAKGENFISNNDFLWNSEDFVSMEDKIGSIFIGK